MVEFVDGSTLVQASPPTMLIPIALGLAWPDRVPDAAPAGRLDQRRRPGSSSRSTTRRSRRCALARRGRRARAARRPAVYNAANEVCVEAFRPGGCRSREIVPTVAAVLAAHDVPSTGATLTVDDVLAADALGPRRGRPAGRDADDTEDQRVSRAALRARRACSSSSAILASIGLHELGHMIPAKKFGGKVTQYFIGFGPTVWSRQRGETEYGVKAIPLGGYVKIVGMLPPGAEHAGEVTYDAEGNQVVKVRKSNTGMFTQLISDARAAEWEHDRARGRRPAVLQDAVVEEGHRDGRRPDGEPR